MRARIVISGVLFALASTTQIAGANVVAPASHAAVTAPSDTTVAQTGTAAGHEFLQFGSAETQSGNYSTSGQLGSGRYLFNATYDDTHCTSSGGTLTLTGTARLRRSDEASLVGTVSGVEACDSGLATPATFTITVASGTRDLHTAHLQLQGLRSGQSPIYGGEEDVTVLTITGMATFHGPVGYWLVGSTGVVTGFGGLTALGNAPSNGVTHLEPTPTHNGYWIVDSAGHVFAFGDATWLGNATASSLATGETVTGLAATATGRGYWLFTTRGRVVPFGDAPFLGDMHTVALNGPVIGAVATPTGDGYYMVASDGGVFTFGDAVFRGSMGSARLNRPVNGLVPTADNTGYWLVASDGGVFAFNAPFLGSTGNLTLNQPVVGMTRYGTGYLMVARDGGLFNFSNEPFFGSLGAAGSPSPTVGIAAAS